jgi:hypothetical protein
MLLVIDSKNRDYATSATGNFTITLKNAISNFTSVKLKEICLDYRPYNVSATYGTSTFTFMEGLATATFTVADGFYSPSDLCQHIQNGMNAQSPNNFLYGVSYDLNTQCFTIESTSSFAVVNSSLGVAMGYATQLPASSTRVSERQILSEPDYFYLNIAELKQNVPNESKMLGSFVFNPHVNPCSEYNGLLSQCINYSKDGSVQLTKLTVSILDSAGNVYDLQNGLVYFILEIL